MNNFDYFHKFNTAKDFGEVAHETIMRWQMDVWDFLDAAAYCEELNQQGLSFKLRVNENGNEYNDYKGEIYLDGKWYPVDGIDYQTGLQCMEEIAELGW